MLTNDEKATIIRSILDLIQNFSDKQYQEKVWIKGGEFGYGFDDSVCDFFPSVEDVLLNCENFSLTRNQYLILKRFTEEFQQFSDDHDEPIEFIHSPEWAKIRSRAQEVLDAFNFHEKP